MRVRLAFAVAAHLEPDILVVDEVLAVGDAEFQKKAIGKMKDISGNDGRTVLFVSHNMAAVKSLCTRGIVLENGTSVFEGTAEESVDHYLSLGNTENLGDLKTRTDRHGNGKMKLIDISFYNINDKQVNEVISGESLKIKFKFEKYDPDIDFRNFFIGVNFRDEQEQTVLNYLSDEMGSTLNAFNYKEEVMLEVPKIYLRAGSYDLRVQIGIGTGREGRFDSIEKAASIQVLPGKIWDNGILNRPGNFAVIPGEFKF
jgi:lipopolysaccharide transport system ATP-binding protein